MNERPMNEPGSEETIFAEALRLSAEERANYLDQAAKGDAALRQRVEALLISYHAGDFLEEAPAPALRQTVRLSVPLTERAGDKIGRYKLLQQIGEGGCGVVYMAEQEEPVRRRVALKVIKLGMDTKSVMARFEAERQALALMDHPNIAKVFDAGATETGRPYFVMELVRGLKITDYCDEAKLSFHGRLELFMQVCHAIQHAHQKGIIHRDIKPSNILVTINDGVAVPKVIDFGIAKATGGQQLTDKTIFTAFEQFIGTPAYMSPEQAVLTSLDIDTRSDIYALGVLLYELLTGTTPFDTKELLAVGLDEMRRTIREKEPARPSTRLSTLSDKELSTTAQRRGIDAPKLAGQLRGDLDWIVIKCLEKDRARRYETANGLAADIERHLRNEPVVACPPSNLYRLRKLVRRNKIAFAALSVVVLSLLIGMTASAIFFARERTARRRADEQAAVAKAVTDFLQNDILRQATVDTQVEEGIPVDTNLTVRQAVDRASAHLASRFTNQPLVEASICDTLASIYKAMGDLKAALPHTQHALELRQRILGTKDPLTLETMWNLADGLEDAGEREKAVPLAEEGLRLARSAMGPEDAATLGWMQTLGELYVDTSHSDKGMPLLEEAVKLSTARLGPEDMRTLWAQEFLGHAYVSTGRAAEAIPLLEATIKLAKGKGGANTLTYFAAGALSVAYRSTGRPNDAIRLLEEIENLPHDPYNSYSSAVFGNNLGAAYLSAHQPEKAIPLLEEALKLTQTKLGPDDPATLTSMKNLAFAYHAAGRLQDALPLFEEAARVSMAKRGLGDRETRNVIADLCLAYEKAGRKEESVRFIEKAFDQAKTQLGSDHPATLSLMNILGLVYQRTGRTEDALRVWEECCRRCSKVKFDPQEYVNRAVTLHLAGVYEKNGRISEALRLLDRLLTPDLVANPKSADRLSDLLSLRSRLLARSGKWDAAAADLGRLIDFHQDDLMAWHNLAAVLVQTGQLDSYRELCAKALKQFGNTTDPVTAERIAKECLILPDSGADLVTVARMAQCALTSTNYPSNPAWCQLAQSLADYRQGRFASAADWAGKALMSTDAIPSRDVAACMVQAMARWRLHQPDEARAALAKGSELAETKLSKLQVGDLGGYWQDGIFAQALLREAKALIENQPVMAKDAAK